MKHDTNAQPAQQLPLFEQGETLAEVSVPADSTEATVRDIGRALTTLVRYHDAKSVQP